MGGAHAHQLGASRVTHDSFVADGRRISQYRCGGCRSYTTSWDRHSQASSGDIPVSLRSSANASSARPSLALGSSSACHTRRVASRTRFRITFADGRVEEYEDPMTFDLPGSTLKVFNGRERTGLGTIYYSPNEWKTVELIR